MNQCYSTTLKRWKYPKKKNPNPVLGFHLRIFNLLHLQHLAAWHRLEKVRDDLLASLLVRDEEAVWLPIRKDVFIQVEDKFHLCRHTVPG